MSSAKAAAIWDEVQGVCDAARMQRALVALADTRGTLDGWTPLHFCCENRAAEDAARVDAIRALTKFGIDANAADEVGWIVGFLSLDKADGFVCAVQNGWAALHLLCKNKHAGELSSSVAALVAGGANASLATLDSKKTALHLLCENEAVSAAALAVLLKATTSVNAVDADGNAPLHYLTENMSLSTELLSVMLEAKADANLQNQFLSTPFHNLGQHNRLSAPLVRSMLHHKANPNLPNNIGTTAFHYACENFSLTLEILHEFIISKQVNLTTTNTLGKTALDLIPAHKHDCLAVAQKLGVPSLGTGAGLSSAKDAVTAGGEDASELPSPLEKELVAWNTSLPPFDMAFYNAVCCEPAFAAVYEHVQDVSAQVCESPSDGALLQGWELALAKWRTQLLLAFTALVSPDLWGLYAEKYNRGVPSDVTKVRAKVIDAWAKFPGPTQRRERFEVLGTIFKTA